MNVEIFQAKIRRHRKSKSMDGKGGNVSSAYTDDEGFGSQNDQPHNGPESLNLSLNGNLNTPVNTTTTTPVTPTGKFNLETITETSYFSVTIKRPKSMTF